MATTPDAGTRTLATDLTSIDSRLATKNTTLNNYFSTSIKVVPSGATAGGKSTVSNIQNIYDTLKNRSMASKTVIPSAGTLIQAALMANIETDTAAYEAICAYTACYTCSSNC